MGRAVVQVRHTVASQGKEEGACGDFSCAQQITNGLCLGLHGCVYYSAGPLGSKHKHHVLATKQTRVCINAGSRAPNMRNKLTKRSSRDAE